MQLSPFHRVSAGFARRVFGVANFFKPSGLYTVRRRPPLLPGAAALPGSAFGSWHAYQFVIASSVAALGGRKSPLTFCAGRLRWLALTGEELL